MIEVNYEYITTEEGVNRALADLINKKYLSIDTETTGLDPFIDKMHCMQIGDQYKQYIFDYIRTKPYIQKILNLFKDDNISWVGQNLKFDYKVLKQAYGVAPRHMLDTMLAEQLLINGKKGISPALDAIAYKYINTVLKKDIRGSFQDHSYGSELNDDQKWYAAMDVVVPIPILREQVKYIKTYGLMEVFMLECDAIKPTAEMELNGIFLDSAAWTDLYDQSVAEADKAKGKLDAIFYDHCEKDMFNYPIINYNSPTQLLPVLQKITGLNIQKTDKPTLDKYKSKHEAIRTLLEYRKATKRCTTYGSDFLTNIHNQTGRVHSSYAQLRAETGRYTSSNPNMQNIPALQMFRSCFRPKDTSKTVMYTADYSGCELRILAELSGDKRFRQIFIDGLDSHKAVASILTGTPYDDITDELRKQYKAVNFGVTYGMGPLRLAETLKITMDQAKNLMNDYYTAFPGIRQFLYETTVEVKNRRKAISTLDGRSRDLSSLDWDSKKHVGHACNIAKNMPFQGGNASMIKKGMVILYDKIEATGRDDLKLVGCVHDEFVVEGDKDKTEEGKKIVMDAMIEAGEYYVKSVPMVVGMDVGTHWIKG